MTTEEENKANEQFDEALDRLEGQHKVTSQDIQFVLDVMKKEAPYDEIAIKQLFYGCASAFTKTPINHNVNSRKSGAGKTYNLTLVSGYFPNRYVLSFVGMSDKALLHEQGVQVMVDEETGNTIFAEPIISDLKRTIEELEKKIEDPKYKSEKRELRNEIKQYEIEVKDVYKKCEKLIILDNRIILLLDTAQEGLYNTLMSMISQDTSKDQIYQFTDKQGWGKLGAAKNRLRGTPALFTTQVIDDSRQVRFQEKNRRFIHVTPTISSEKIKSAVNLISKRYGLLPEEYDEQVLDSADREHAREIVGIIVDKLIDHSKLLKPKESGVKIPFTESVNHGIGGDETEWSMTVMDRMLRYLVIITKVNMDSRPRVLDTETGKSYPISTFADLKETLQLMKTGASLLRPYLADWYNRVFLPYFKELVEPNKTKDDMGNVTESEQYKGLSTEQLANRTFDVMKIKSDRRGIREQYLYPLSNTGIINIVRSSINRNEVISYPVEEGNIFSIFNDENDLRLEITDLSLFPSRKLLEESFRTIVKQEDKGGVLKINNKFRLVDEDGIDISTDELIDRYLADPETCFKTDDEDKNNENFYPPVCPPVLTEIPKNIVEESSIPERVKKLWAGRYECENCHKTGKDQWEFMGHKCNGKAAQNAD
jgi:hypothetical protein